MINLTTPYKFLKYSADNLALALETSYYSESRIRKNFQYIYLLDYFDSVKGIDANTILVEKDYFSESYYEDFHSNHILNYNEYSKFCNRVHFFSKPIPRHKDELDIFNKNSTELKDFWDSYLGYIVVRPLPTGLIGATILKHYPISFGESKLIRHFPATREYKVNIFGIEVKVNSLIFEEQDSILVACATAALWSAFDKLTHLFSTPVISPSYITIAAGRSTELVDRLFPNSGLDVLQIRNAINSIGLECEIRAVENGLDYSWLRGIIYAYCKMGIPIILGIEFPLEPGQKENDRHAITITGFLEPINQKENQRTISEHIIKSKKAQDERLTLRNEILFKKFYAHDDQIGPFSRIFINKNSIRTAWWDGNQLNKADKKILVAYYALIVPITKQIRITYENICTELLYYNQLFEEYFNIEEICWEVFLEQSNAYKNKLRSEPSISNEKTNSILFASLPRYIWVAVLYIDEINCMEIVFDASSINYNFSSMKIIIKNEDFRKHIHNYLLKKNYAATLANSFLTTINSSWSKDRLHRAHTMIQVLVLLTNSFNSHVLKYDDRKKSYSLLKK